MTIAEKLKEKRTLVSCELFPPKRHLGFENAKAVIDETLALSPDFISVTYGAAGGAYKNTMGMAEYIEQNGCTALMHLTCVGSTHETIGGLIDSMRSAGIRNVLALRGDIVDGQTPKDYLHAIDLVGELKAAGGFCVGAACYPEGHVEAANQAEDIRYLKEKADAGCDFLTTQMFFDNNILYRFLYRIREAGIHTPVFAGIMPVTNKAQIKRIVEVSGTALPPRFQNILDKFGEDERAMQQAGIAYAIEQIIDLIANGVRGVHIYTMNKPAVARQIIEGIDAVVRAVS